MENIEHTARQTKNTKVLVPSILLLSVTLSVLLLFVAAPRSEGQVQDHSTPPGLRTAAQAGRGASPEEARLLRGLGQARVGTHAETGELSSLSAPEGGAIGRPPGMPANAPAETAARGYMSKYGPLFGIEDQKSALRTEGTKRAYEGKGRSVVSFQQVYKGVPVMAGELNVEVDGENDLLVANGEALPDISLDTEPSVGVNEAQQTALQKVAKDNDVSSAGLRASAPELWIYDSRLLGGPGLDVPQLVWRMDISSTSQPAGPDELVLVDAHSGYVVLNFDQTESALDRQTFTMNHNGDEDALPGQLWCTEVLNPTCLGDADAKNAHDYARDTYNFYSKHYKRDSLNGQGMTITSSVTKPSP